MLVSDRVLLCVALNGGEITLQTSLHSKFPPASLLSTHYKACPAPSSTSYVVVTDYIAGARNVPRDSMLLHLKQEPLSRYPQSGSAHALCKLAVPRTNEDKVGEDDGCLFKHESLFCSVSAKESFGGYSLSSGSTLFSSRFRTECLPLTLLNT